MTGDGQFSPPPTYRGSRRRRILVVDDNIDAAESLAVLLTHMGHDVQVAHDGRAALEASRMNHPQIVLLDLGMPGVDGFDLIPFIAVTGHDGPEARRRTREAGFDEHLVKPVSVDALRKLLERY